MGREGAACQHRPGAPLDEAGFPRALVPHAEDLDPEQLAAGRLAAASRFGGPHSQEGAPVASIPSTRTQQLLPPHEDQSCCPHTPRTKGYELGVRV